MIFVTGGTGFIGAHLLYHLLRKGYAVRALKRESSDLDYVQKVIGSYSEDGNRLFQKVEWVDGDIMEYATLLENSVNVEAVVHCAAVVSFSPEARFRMLQTNIGGTANVVNAALENGVKKLVYVSSVAALDPVREGQVVTEEDFGNFPQRYSWYAESKFKSELEVWRGIEEGLDAVVVNPSIVIGPLVPEVGAGGIFKTIRNGFRFYPTGVTGYVDVRDVSRIVLQLMEGDIVNKRFIVSAGNYSYKELFGLIAKEYGIKPPRKEIKPLLTNIAWRLDAVRSLMPGQNRLITKELHRSAHRKVYFSNEKIKNTLGYQFIPMEQTVRDTIRFNDR